MSDISFVECLIYLSTGSNFRVVQQLISKPHILSVHAGFIFGSLYDDSTVMPSTE
jgi:hypothetical protein